MRRSQFALMLMTSVAPLFARQASAEGTHVSADSRVFMLLDRYNETWTTPSRSQQGSMPIGNGEIGLNVWVEEGGDLLFYIARTDSWDANASLLKLGRVRVSLDPNPFTAGTPFRQELRLRDGEIAIAAGAEGAQVRLRVWVDANRPVIHIEAAGDRRFRATVGLKIWRTADRELTGRELHHARIKHNFGRNHPIIVRPDTLLPAEGSSVRWYHRNTESSYPLVLKLRNCEELQDKYPDPLMHRTFGGIIYGDGLVSEGDASLRTPTPVTRFHAKVVALTEQTDTEQQWLDRLMQLKRDADEPPLAAARRAHQEWWHRFWKRSWVFASGDDQAEAVTRGYVLQRWINACNGRGRYAIKFNGALFTVGLSSKVPGVHDPETYDADYRRWGGCYWFQNTRLPYWGMLASGDYDLMKPFFRMYSDMIPFRKERVRAIHGHEGASYGEIMFFCGLESPAGNWTRYYWQSGLELSAMMLDYYFQSQDESFARSTMVPTAEAVLTFYEQHYKKDGNGRLLIAPAQSLETYRIDVVNPLPVLAGLRAVLSRLLLLPDAVTTAVQRDRWREMLAAVPPIPIRSLDGTVRLLPAEKYRDKRGNIENPELYSIFPYRLHAVGQPDLRVALNSWPLRGRKGAGCWHQDLVHCAQIGISEEARAFAFKLATSKDRLSRFPAFWSGGHDWNPDQCHGGNLMLGIHRMLLQWDDKGKIYLLPAWPKEWDVEFKLYASRKTTVEGSYVGRTLTTTVTPETRRRDVVVSGQ